MLRRLLTLVFVLVVGCVSRPPTLSLVPPGGPMYADALQQQLQQAWNQRPADYVPRTRHVTPSGDPAFTNRLFLETSPYLRQHAHNPVDWYPWGDEAFEAAKRLGRPVLLSVGYSTCHWCHVMEEESFEDIEIARYLNENYVAIKVDREERPDVDAVYMAAVQALTGRGGWPMTVWLTPDREPFHGGTYFPARDGDRGTRMGFLTLVQKLRTVYDDQPDEVVARSQQISAHIRQVLAGAPSAGLPDAATLTSAAETYKQRYDPVNGGLQGAPKFPSNLPIRFLVREAARTGDAELQSMAVHTLHQMAAGGMYDQLAGGFHRYSTDDVWLVPHFEKMLYDNALLAVAYTEGWQLTADPALERVARDILTYVARDMTSPDGAFYSATDADSAHPGTGERVEGWYFSWTEAEIREVLDQEHAEAVLGWYAVGPGGNFEGRSILHTPRAAATVAANLGLSEGRLLTLIAEARGPLLAARSQRPPPLLDDKIIAAFNGLMISAYARASLAFAEPDYANKAATAADFVLSRMRVDGRLLRTYSAGRPGHTAVIEDYAFMISGLIDLFEATGERRWLDEAIALDGVVKAHYEDPAGGWFRTADDAEALLAREKPQYDGAVPSGASVQLLNLYRLGELTTQDDYRVRAEAGLRAAGESITRGAGSEALLAVDWMLDTPREIVLVTPSSRAQAEPFLQVLRRGPRNRVLVVTTDAEVEGLVGLVPLVDGKRTRGGATAYVCERGLCELPTTDVAVFRGLLEGGE